MVIFHSFFVCLLVFLSENPLHSPWFLVFLWGMGQRCRLVGQRLPQTKDACAEGLPALANGERFLWPF